MKKDLIMGGQGRSAESVEWSGWVCFWCAAIGAIIVTVAFIVEVCKK